MRNRGIKNLLINLDDVLINPDRECYIENLKKIGFQNIEGKFRTYRLGGIFLQQRKGLIIPTGFHDDIRGMVGRMVSNKQVDATWNSFLVDIPTYKFDLLLKPRKRYVVYLLGNTNDIRRERACKNAFPHRTPKIENYFEKACLSHEVKMAESEPEIFKAVTEDAGINPGEAFLIDDFETSCKVAQGLGISVYTPKVGKG